MVSGWVDDLGEAQEEVQNHGNGAPTECVKYFIDAGNHDLGNICDFVEFTIVYGDSDTTRFLWNACQAARQRWCGVLNAFSGKV